MLRVLDLFSGIGGFTLGLEPTGGFETICFCEIDKFCQQVLRKNWPGVYLHDDITTLVAPAGVDVITGGFPCQDISVARLGGAGLDGKKSGLWTEYLRLISEVRPKYAIIENVAHFRSGGGGEWFRRFLKDLAAIRYDAEWHCISAAHIGAPHRRDRIWIIAYPTCDRFKEQSILRIPREGMPEVVGRITDGLSENCTRHPERGALDGLRARVQSERENFSKSSSWAVEPPVARVVYGVPTAAHRIKALGNSVVPQIVTLLGDAILDYEESHGRYHRAIR